MSRSHLQLDDRATASYRRRGRFALGAVLGLGLALANSGQALAANHLERAEHLLANGHVRNARIELRNALKQDSNRGHAAYLLGRLDLEMGDPVSAERNAHEALAAGYQPGPSLTLLLDSLLEQNRYDDLLRRYRLDGATGERGARIAVARARANLALARPEAAAHDFAKAEKLDPHLPELWLAKETDALDRHDLAAARTALHKAAAAGANTNQVTLRRAQLLLANQKPKEAVKVLTALVAKSPGFFSADLAYADALAAAGDTEKARGEVHAVMKLLPNSALALYLLAALDVQSHDWKGAQNLLQKLQPVMDKIPAAYLLQAQTDAGLGLKAAAVSAAQHYVARRPDDPNGHIALARLALAHRQPKLALKTLAPGTWPKSAKPDVGMLILRGEAERQIGAINDARADFAHAVAMAPHDVTAMVDLASTEQDENHPKAALGTLRRAAAEPNAKVDVQRMLAQAAIRAGDTATAKTAIETYQRHAGADAAAPIRAEFDFTQGNLVGARKTLTQLHKDRPGSVAAVIGLARLDLIEGDAETARSLLEQAAKRRPADAQIVSTLVRLQLAAHDTAAAVKTLEAAHKAGRSNPAFISDLIQLYLTRKDTNAAAALLNGLSSDMAGNPAILLASARLALAQKHPDLAQAKLQALLHAKPDATKVRLALAQLDVSMKHENAARAVLDNGLSRSPHDVTLMQARVGLALHESGVTAAQAEAHKLAGDPVHQPQSSELPGDLLLSQHKAKEAAAAYAAAYKAAPSPALAFDQAKALLSAGHEAEAEKVLKTSATRYPKAAGFPLLLAQLALNRNDLPKAAKLYRQALDLAPSNVLVLNNLAWVEQRLGKPDATQLAERAFTLSPSPQTADTLGWIQFKGEGGAHGLALLASAHQRAPKDPDIAYHYAAALSAAGRTKQAANVLGPLMHEKQVFRDRSAAQVLYQKLDQGS